MCFLVCFVPENQCNLCFFYLGPVALVKNIQSSYDRMARLVAGGVISGWKVEFFRVGSWEPIVVACFNPKP